MTYLYEREDGTRFEAKQSMKEEPLEECPETGQPCKRVITGGVGFHLKGGGWFDDDAYSSTDT